MYECYFYQWLLLFNGDFAVVVLMIHNQIIEKFKAAKPWSYKNLTHTIWHTEFKFFVVQLKMFTEILNI